MLISEFIDRTGYRPTDREYHSVIEPAYYDYPHDKDSFCHQWLLNRLKVVREYIAGFEKRMQNGEKLTDISIEGYRFACQMQSTFSEKLILLYNKIYGNS